MDEDSFRGPTWKKVGVGTVLIKNNCVLVKLTLALSKGSVGHIVNITVRSSVLPVTSKVSWLGICYTNSGLSICDIFSLKITTVLP